VAKKRKKSSSAPASPSPGVMDRDTALHLAISSVEKQFGKGAIYRLGDDGSEQRSKIDTVSTGSITLDKALTVGGYPRGRVIEVFGPEACLDGDTFIQYTVWGADGKRVNHKGGTIRRLWERFHGKSASGDGRGKKYLHPSSIGVTFTAPCVNEENCIFHNNIIDVVQTGSKECYELTTVGGSVIVATEDHKFFTGEQWVALSDLNPGDTLMIHNNTPFRASDSCCDEDEKEYRKYVHVRHHPVGGKKMVRERVSRTDPSLFREYEYRRLSIARVVVEASMNNLSYEEYIERLNSGDLDGLSFLERDDHVHHLDENITNNDLNNLLVMSASEHSRLRALDRHNNLRFRVLEDQVFSIVPVGLRETYDIKMENPFNNYVANEFVVHNSGKTTICLHAIASVQRLGEVAAIVDAEHALDMKYARHLGVDVDNLLVSQPDYGEQALEIVETLMRSSAVSLIVVDSVAALVPRAEIEGDMGDSHVGLQARLMSQACRKLAGLANSTGTILYFTNQLRMKIGVQWGNPETTTGGNALKFYASVRLDVRRIGKLKSGDELKGHRARIKVVKNKVAPPFQEAEVDIVYNRGIAPEMEILNLGVDLGILEKKGAYFSYDGENIGQGKFRAADHLLSQPELFQTLYNLVRNACLSESFDEEVPTLPTIPIPDQEIRPLPVVPPRPNGANGSDSGGGKVPTPK